jgi:PKD repeat protein
MTYRAGATANNNQAANTGTASVTIPTSGPGGTVIPGDTALFCMVQNSGSSVLSPPVGGGWAPLFPDGPKTINSNLRTQVWVKDLVSGDIGATVAFTSNVGARLPGVLSIISGTSAAAVIAEFNAIATADSTAPYLVTSPVINTLVNGSDVVGFWVLRDPTGIPAPSLTVPASHTADSVSKTNFGTSPNFTVQASHRTTPGAAGPYGGSTAESSEPVTAIVIYAALPPAEPSPPVASFTASPSSGPAPLAVTFTDTSTGTPTSWAWNFGDGSTSTAQNPSHTYTSAGTYEVSMTASNAGGSDAAVTATVTVAAASAGGGLHLMALVGGVYETRTLYGL